MAIRFAPFARIRVLSLATELLKFGNFNTTLDKSIFSSLATKLKDTQAKQKEIDPSDFFTDIGLATEISITETFNTRAQYGIGEPANPTIVPGNLSVRVTMSRLTTDSKQMADYITSPRFYYSNLMQRASASLGLDTNNTAIKDLDLLFYTYLHLGSIETAKAGQTNMNDLSMYQNYELIAFMPNSFTKRLSAQNAEVITEVEGEGKLYRMNDLLNGIFKNYDANVDALPSSRLGV